MFFNFNSYWEISLKYIIIFSIACSLMAQEIADKPKSKEELQREYFKKALYISSIQTQLSESKTDNQKKMEATIRQLAEEFNKIKSDLSEVCKKYKKELDESTGDCIEKK